MLTVPATIQTLFKTDGIRKNFRVHFPNGENADLTNADIVQESVTFTESVCSRSVFQFGLSERSEIDFECVGVQNIYGMTIECGIEIDTSSLSAAEITTIQNDPGDGTLVLAANSDIGYGYYRVPYGVFVVENCPRSHGAMQHRKVTAYAQQIPQYPTGFLGERLMVYMQDVDTIEQNVYLLLASEENNINGIPMSETTLNLLDSTATAHIPISKPGIGIDYLHISYKEKYSYTDAGQFNPTAMHRATCASTDPAYYDSLIADLESRGYSIYDSSAADIKKRFYPYLKYYLYNVTHSPQDTIFLNADTGYIYTYLGISPGGLSCYSQFHFPYEITSCYITGESAGSGVHIADYATASGITVSPEVKLYEMTDSTQMKFMISFKGTSQTDISNANYYAYLNAVDLRQLKDGMLELFGKFGGCGRDGTLKEISLSTASPIAIAPSQYSSLWWDDYSIDSVGSMVVKYNDVDLSTQQTILYVFGSGNSRYDMTDNYLLLNYSKTAADLGQSILEFVENTLYSSFVPAAGEITYTPSDAEMIGLPYLEAGDYLGIDDSDGGTVYTYILRRELSGIQMLTDTIEATGGEIIRGR